MKSPMRNADHAVTYARVSTDRQDARSVDDQIRRCRVFAKGRGLRVIGDYSDVAVSGTHTARAELQRLLADAGQKQFGAVLIDDLSRLSRDLGDVWSLIFGTFAALDIVVVDCMTGLASNSPGARMTFGAMGLVSDGFIEQIRTETHRGLQGRALAGFATGGRTYGFSTVQEPNPPDPEHARKVRVVQPAEAAIVLRVFKMFSEGTALKKVASHLNDEGTAAPHDGGRGNKGARGWGHTTILHMLRNEQYVGVWRWNREKWLQIPGTARYRRIPRPESEHVVHHSPDLRIVPQPLWADVQARLRRQPRGRGTKPGVGKRHGSIFSGLLRCGACGGSVNIIGRRKKAGKEYVNLGCAVARSRGDSVCGNRRTVSERKLFDHLRAELRTLVDHPEALKIFVDAYQGRIAELQKRENTTALEKELREAQRRLDNLTEALAEMGRSRSVREKHEAQEAIVSNLEVRIAETRRQVVIPHPAKVSGELRDLLGLMSKDVPRAREALARLMPQPFRMFPEADGYRIEGGLQLGLPALNDGEDAVPIRSSRRDRD
jgi:site-specific DNA recombinase